MHVTFDGVEYEFEIEAITRSEAAYIKRRTNMTLGGMLKGVADLDPDAVAAMFWLMLKQNGTNRDIDKMDDFPILKFGNALVEAFALEEEEDPTGAGPAAA
jgi:hypothetical protein